MPDPLSSTCPDHRAFAAPNHLTGVVPRPYSASSPQGSGASVMVRPSTAVIRKTVVLLSKSPSPYGSLMGGLEDTRLDDWMAA